MWMLRRRQLVRLNNTLTCFAWIRINWLILIGNFASFNRFQLFMHPHSWMKFICIGLERKRKSEAPDVKGRPHIGNLVELFFARISIMDSLTLLYKDRFDSISVSFSVDLPIISYMNTNKSWLVDWMDGCGWILSASRNFHSDPW